MKVSPGFIMAMKAAWLAVLPECGCTLAKRHLNSFLARAIARFSASSTYWQPP